ncbi:hypothetical protein TTHERM_000688471 (macronuclear) [Tetrahymena thermophila SB210]|uniref:Uncharacterized protein n=1 Tax=Tetrahymena thermophila (strain SB210) TaxID=312017 RepID=W7WWK1_TETTS|nr:hypothetical protein TTHERM_000688471 [Tetrahymena thermophila SB210]EWS71200.1 hypothetical protein TTHERM_000688471 [Tetrahymena thermophila SB210]|eukprot:XP_012656253.1 hypothetical protein TTHERM_000688471 [Tetrahymena thermophila SB210]
MTQKNNRKQLKFKNNFYIQSFCQQKKKHNIQQFLIINQEISTYFELMMIQKSTSKEMITLFQNGIIGEYQDNEIQTLQQILKNLQKQKSLPTLLIYKCKGRETIHQEYKRFISEINLNEELIDLKMKFQYNIQVGNILKDLSQAISQFYNLQDLYISINYLDCLNQDFNWLTYHFKNLVNLRRLSLNLQKNDINDFDLVLLFQNIYDCPNLKILKIKLEYNKLKEHFQELNINPNLQQIQLFMSQNKINSKGLSNLLEQLSIIGNSLQKIFIDLTQNIINFNSKISLQLYHIFLNLRLSDFCILTSASNPILDIINLIFACFQYELMKINVIQQIMSPSVLFNPKWIYQDLYI